MANGDGGISLAQGFQIGLQLRQTRQQREQLELRKQTVQAQSFDSLMSSLSQLSKAPKTSQPVLKRLVMKKAEVLGAPIAESNLDAMLEQDLKPQTILALDQLTRIDDPKARAQLWSQVTPAFADPERIGDITNTILKINQQQQRRAQIEAQTAGTEVKAAKERVQIQSQVLSSFRQTGGGEDADVVKNANEIFRLAGNPDSRKQAFPADAARVAFSKITDPQGVVREGEVNRLTGLTGDALDRAEGAINRAIQGEQLTDEQWAQLVGVAQLLGQESNQRLGQIKAKFIDPNLRDAGIPTERAEAFIPKLQEFDFKEAGFTPSVIPQGLQKSLLAGRPDFKKQVAGLKKKISEAKKRFKGASDEQIAQALLSSPGVSVEAANAALRESGIQLKSVAQQGR